MQLISFVVQVITKAGENGCRDSSHWAGGGYSQCLALALPGSSPQAPSVAGRKRCTLKGQFKEVKPSLRYA